MRRLFAAVAVLILALVSSRPAIAQAQADNAQAEQQVRTLVNTLNQALMKADVATLNKVLAEEFTLIRANGMMVGKAVAVRDVDSGKTKFDSIEQLDTKIRVYGDTAVMTTLEKTSGQVGGNPFSSQSRNTYFCVKRNGRWQLVLRQMTPVTTPRLEPTAGK